MNHISHCTAGSISALTGPFCLSDIIASMEPPPPLIWELGVGLIIGLVFLAIGVKVLDFAVKKTLGFSLPEGRKYLIVIVTSSVNLLVLCFPFQLLGLVDIQDEDFILNLFFSIFGTLCYAGIPIGCLSIPPGFFQVLLVIMGFAISVKIYGMMIVCPEESRPIGFRKGMKVGRLALLTGLLIGAFLAFVSWVCMSGSKV